MTPMPKTPPQQKPKPLLDKNGKPIINQYGHVVSARLTDEEKLAINHLVAKGYSNLAVCAELNISERRLVTYLKEPKVAAAIATTNAIREQAHKLNSLIELLTEQTRIIARMEKRLSDVQTELQQTKKAAARSRIGREKAERTSRSQRQELTKLKQQLWKRTGLKA